MLSTHSCSKCEYFVPSLDERRRRMASIRSYRKRNHHIIYPSSIFQALHSSSSVISSRSAAFSSLTLLNASTVSSTRAEKSSSLPLNRLYNAPVVTPAFLHILFRDAPKKPLSRNSSLALSSIRGSIDLSGFAILPPLIIVLSII